MQFTVNQTTITKPLQLLCSVVDRRSALPILTHIRLQISQGQLTMTTTDMELEMIGQLKVTAEQEGDITVPARKLLDICRALPAGA
ncbi:MAG TPA: DNA polymerase III subunit beta, partial [Gammaproteobacteria bacterium]|nr:DNA polymerase III subunit beta [Gammaproteobacteria bacterium]